ncbi:hypothetical protein CIRG_01914 [Coccidioides immitis RMSCC 2394]|uniref:Uncharacterized protein n=1 Tax=Coccidioides immitis RMSCC 2394 TaxID=404692 RepID=A0A0J6XZM1_COCIT|nr:hypothetical protein CIRG_01914 [Coccidioides immitis RMSCC 2394]
MISGDKAFIRTSSHTVVRYPPQQATPNFLRAPNNPPLTPNKRSRRLPPHHDHLLRRSPQKIATSERTPAPRVYPGYFNPSHTFPGQHSTGRLGLTVNNRGSLKRIAGRHQFPFHRFCNDELTVVARPRGLFNCWRQVGIPGPIGDITISPTISMQRMPIEALDVFQTTAMVLSAFRGDKVGCGHTAQLYEDFVRAILDCVQDVISRDPFEVAVMSRICNILHVHTQHPRIRPFLELSRRASNQRRVRLTWFPPGRLMSWRIWVAREKTQDADHKVQSMPARDEGTLQIVARGSSQPYSHCQSRG